MESYKKAIKLIMSNWRSGLMNMSLVKIKILILILVFWIYIGFNPIPFINDYMRLLYKSHRDSAMDYFKDGALALWWLSYYLTFLYITYEIYNFEC